MRYVRVCAPRLSDDSCVQPLENVYIGRNHMSYAVIYIKIDQSPLSISFLQ